MIKDKFELSLLTQSSPELLAWVVPGDRLFSWICRSIIIPVGWAALGLRKGQDPIFAGPGKTYEDEDTEDLLFIRSAPACCVVDATDLASADGYACNGTLEVSVRIIEETGELAAFRRTIVGSSEMVRRMDLQRHLQWEMHKVLAELAANHKAEELLNGIDCDIVRHAVESRLGGICLAGGLGLEGPAVAQFDSPAYREHRRQQANLDNRNRHLAARARVQEALARAQKERLSHTVDILQELVRAAESRSDLSVADLLRSFGESERAEMYAALWHLCPPLRRAGQIAVVSGQEVLLFAPNDLERPARRLPLPETLGPLRSVAADARSLEAQLLMVGSRLGVHLVDLDSGNVVDSLSAAELAEGVEIRGGINASAMSDERVYATHSELGVLAWPRGMFGPPVEKLLPEVTAGADTVRSALFAEGQLFFSVDEEVWAQPEDLASCCKPVLYSGSKDRISALTVAGSVIYAGNAAGQVLAWDLGDPDTARIVRGASGSPVESVDVLDGGAVDHLLIADRSYALQSVVVEDKYIRRYESGTMPVRRAAVAGDLFVAINDNRDRLIAWDPHKPSQPSAVVVLPHLTGSTIQDLCIIPQA